MIGDLIKDEKWKDYPAWKRRRRHYLFMHTPYLKNEKSWNNLQWKYYEFCAINVNKVFHALVLAYLRYFFRVNNRFSSWKMHSKISFLPLYVRTSHVYKCMWLCIFSWNFMMKNLQLDAFLCVLFIEIVCVGKYLPHKFLIKKRDPSLLHKSEKSEKNRWKPHDNR